MIDNTRKLGIGTWISFGAPTVTEVVAGMGFDWLLLDLEHGCMTESNMLENIRAAALSGAKVIVRVGELRPSLIGRALDYGAAGIMMPHVTCADEALAVVKALRYPPLGDRGFSSSTRAYGYGAAAPKDVQALPQPLLLVQIEDYTGVMNADLIAAVEGVDVVFVGPRDLGLDLSVRPASQSLQFDDALQRVAAAANGAGKQAGILVRNVADMTKLRAFGFTALAVGSDMGMLRAGYKTLLQSIK